MSNVANIPGGCHGHAEPVTGGTGFIGRAIAAELQRQDSEVVIFDRGYNPVPNTIHRTGTILNPHDLAAAAQDVDEIYHLAGVLGTTELLNQPELAIDSNIKGTLYSLEAARVCGIKRFFYASKPNDWLNMYSITKAAGESICRLFAHEHGIDVRVLRWLNAYGPGQKLYPIRKAIPLFILQAINDLPIEIWGDGSQRIDLIHVDDLAYVTVAFTRASTPFDRALDTGLCHSCTVKEVAELIIKLTKSKSRLKFLRMRPGEDPSVSIPLLPRATDMLGLTRDAIELETGLQQTIDYYRGLSQRDKERALRFYYGSQELRGGATLTLDGVKMA